MLRIAGWSCSRGTSVKRLERLARLTVFGLLLYGGSPGAALAASDPPSDAAAETELNRSEALAAPDRVDVAPRVSDPQIAERLQGVFEATGWFVGPRVRVAQGVAFLDGRAAEERYRDWASDLAQRTEGVVAVVNRIDIETSALDLSPALAGLQSLSHGLARSAPFILVGIFVVLVAYFAGRGATWAFRAGIRRHTQPDLLRELTARGIGLLVFTLGLYLALRVAGLTRLAATVLGGTGILGLVLGIAFRDMAENVLASVLLTRQQPFRKGDLVEISGVVGYVQQLTVRATVLMSLDGNHIQIPNSTVYKSAIRNFTSNPARRIDFTIGIGYADAIAHAQEVALAVLAEHPAVLKTPEPWVLVDSLGSAVVNLRVYAWLDGTKHSWLKVRSSVIRLTKRAFQEQGISMPDEAREIVFPDAVPVHLLHERYPEQAQPAVVTPPPRPREGAEVSTCGEARLETDTATIQRLADDARAPEGGQDLLQSSEERAADPSR